MKEDTESFNCGDEIILILQRLVVTGEREMDWSFFFWDSTGFSQKGVVINGLIFKGICKEKEGSRYAECR